MRQISVALVGAGFMGSSHARVVGDHDVACLQVVVDADAEAAKRLARTCGARPSTDLVDAFDCDVVIVASSTAARMECVLPLIEAGRPLLVEKPFAPTLVELDVLLAASERHGVPVMCGFVERFNAALRTAFQLLEAPPLHMVAVRHSPPAPRILSTVVNDLMLHDLDVAHRLFGAGDGVVKGATCLRPPSHAFNEVADCVIDFGPGIATLSSSRLGQRKIRSLSISCPDSLFEVDLLRQTVSVYRNVSQEIIHSDGGVGYRSATEIDLPFVRHLGEPLALQFEHFLAIATGRGDVEGERRSIRPAHVLADAIEQRGSAE